MENPSYNNKNVLITGGLGFIGSNLAIRLVNEGAKVTIIDSKIHGQGSNEFNIIPIKDKIKIDYSDIRNKNNMLKNIKNQEVVFNLAAKIINPNPKLESRTNYEGQKNLLESCKEMSPNCRVIFSGSRLVYGNVGNENLPAKENLQLNPLNQYAKDKVEGERLHQEYFNKHGLDTVCLRITNPYGPRGQMKHAKYGIVNWFIRQAMEDGEIKIFGDGSRSRDYIYIDDLIESFLIAGVHPSAKGKIYNIGSGIATSLNKLAETIVKTIGSGKISYAPLPKNEKNTETNDFYADISKIRKEIGWSTRTSLKKGINKTEKFYEKNLKEYI